MSAEIIPFPDGWTPEQQDESLFDLHTRLMEHLAHDKPDKGEGLVLSIDDVVQLCELIEQRLGPDLFDDDPA